MSIKTTKALECDLCHTVTAINDVTAVHKITFTGKLTVPATAEYGMDVTYEVCQKCFNTMMVHLLKMKCTTIELMQVGIPW